MKVTVENVRVIFESKCSGCKKISIGDTNENGELFVTVDEIINNGSPMCECGLHLDYIGSAEII